MKKSPPLGTRLVILGVSGPLVSTLLFLGFASIASVTIARQASLELSTLFQRDNRASLRHTIALIQASASRTSQELEVDSASIRRNLRGLAIDQAGVLTWQGQRFQSAQAAALLNDLLRLPLSPSLSEKSSALFFKNDQGRWHRLTGITSAGAPLRMNWQVPEATVRQLEALYFNRRGLITPRNTLLRQGEQWRVTRLTPLEDSPLGRRLVVAVSMSTDAASGLLATGAQLFPQADHEVAFFLRTPTGQLYCDYARPNPSSCRDMQTVLSATGGIPGPRPTGEPALVERQEPPAAPGQPPRPRRTLFVATFPSWNWLAAIAVDENALEQTLRPMQRETVRVITGLIGLSGLLMLGCAAAAWRLARGITRQLQALAEAADALASGQTRQVLSYEANDGLGQLVRAFNRMAGAVAEREQGLRAQIHELTISINRQSLQGQVCSILEDPGFSDLSERARTMRERRHRLSGSPATPDHTAPGTAADRERPPAAKDDAAD